MMKRWIPLLLLVALMATLLSTVGVAAENDILTGNVDTKTITTDTVLDLNGYSIGTLIVNDGVTVTVKDSKTDDYTVADGIYGKITTIQGEVIAADGYVMIRDVQDNKTSFHKLTLKTSGVALRADQAATEGADMYYVSEFGGDEVIKRNIVAYGVALGAGSEPNFADKTYTRITDLSGWTTGKLFKDNGTLLQGVLKTDRTYSLNKYSANVQVYNVAYIELNEANGGTRILGGEANRSLRDIVSDITASNTPGKDYWDTMTYQQKSNIVDLHETFKIIIGSWSLPRLDGYLDNKSYDLYTVSDLQMMAEKPNQKYVLKSNIDMNNVVWTPFEFSGVLTGNDYSISNLTVSTAGESGMGFFSTVSASASVQDVHFRNVTLQAAETNAQNIGGIAGINHGSITGCTVTGTIFDDRTGTEKAPIYAGALVGTNNGTLTPGNDITITHNLTDVTGKAVTYTTNGLAAEFGFRVADSDYVKTGLAGKGSVSGQWRDISYATKYQDATLQAKRQTVVDYVHQSGTLKWTMPSGKTVTYYADKAKYPNVNKPSNVFESFFGGDWHIHNQRFTSGKTYVGIPYAHTSSSLEQFQYYAPLTNGIYTMRQEIAAAGDADWEAGKVGFAQYIGSDCSGALIVAWHKVSPILTNNKTNGGISPVYTDSMIPSEYNQWYFGIRKIGDYEVVDAEFFAGVSKDAEGNELTYTDKNSPFYGKKRYIPTSDEIVKKIGAAAIYEAYAQTRMGDILVSSGTAGHARMAALDPVVIRNADGSVDPAKSYFISHEQGDGLYEKTTTNSSWRINYRYTFEVLAYQTENRPVGSNGYYVPISMDAFHELSIPTSAKVSFSGGIKDTTDPVKCVLNSAFRIQSATLTVKDANGNVKYEKTAFQGASANQNRRRASPGYVPMYFNEFFSDYGKNLTTGQTYYFTIQGTSFSGTTTTLLANQEFVYNP